MGRFARSIQREEETVAELVSKYEVHSTQIKWLKESCPGEND